MASRSPASADLSYSLEDIHPGEDIIETTPDVVLDNQEWMLDREGPAYADVWYPVEMSGNSYVALKQIWARAIDRCGTDALQTAVGYILAWSNNALTFYVRLQTAGGTDTLTVTTNETQKYWRGPIGTLNDLDSAGGDEYCTISAAATGGGTQYVWVAGVAFVTPP